MKNNNKTKEQYLDEIGKLNNKITKLEKYETKRNQGESMLRQYEHIVSSSTDMLALLDKRFNYLVANKAYMDAFKLNPKQLIGRFSSKSVWRRVLQYYYQA